MIATEHASLPPLSWLCAVSPGGDARLQHGPGVVVQGDAFFEGAWSGTFDAMGFDACAAVFGSGGARRGGSWIFVPPSHTLEALYVARLDGATVVSNSLAFLLAYSGTALLPFDWSYGERFASIVLGLHATPVHVPVTRGTVLAVHHHNVTVGQPGEPALAEKPLPPSFSSFHDYVRYVEGTLRTLAENADAPARRRRYRLLSTISAGYDSPACAVLARAAGCREAITLAGTGEAAEDSGAEIAQRLGLELHVVAVVPPEGDDGVEAECLATGMQGEDVVYRAFADHLPGRVLVTGFHGDKMWERTIHPTPDIKRGDISGSSLGEFRLVRDFVHVPVPFIGCRRHEDVWRISNAAEMQPYSIGGHYDRPVARRLLESAGVPRDAFARTKRAASRHIFLDPSLLGATTRRAIAASWRARRVPLGDRLRYAAAAARWQLGLLAVELGRASRRLRPAASASGGGAFADRRSPAFRRVFGTDFAVFEHAHPRASVWLRWAVERIGERYRDAGTLAGAARQ